MGSGTRRGGRDITVGGGRGERGSDVIVVGRAGVGGSDVILRLGFVQGLDGNIFVDVNLGALTSSATLLVLESGLQNLPELKVKGTSILVGFRVMEALALANEKPLTKDVSFNSSLPVLCPCSVADSR